jgi:DNA-binding NtrC family response regulator
MIEELERKYLLDLLQKHNGSVTKIAVDAGMTRRNLHRLLNRYGLKAEAWRKGSSQKKLMIQAHKRFAS